jgi:rubrerythrin
MHIHASGAVSNVARPALRACAGRHLFDTITKDGTMTSKAYNDILELAITAEIEAAQFYREVSRKTGSHFLRELFLTFSEEEQKHRRILENFRDDPSLEIAFEKVPDFHVSETVETPALSIDLKPADAIALAMKKEEAAMRQYSLMAEAAADPKQKELFLELAAMERGHKAKMEQAFVDIGYPEVW